MKKKNDKIIFRQYNYELKKIDEVLTGSLLTEGNDYRERRDTNIFLEKIKFRRM